MTTLEQSHDEKTLLVSVSVNILEDIDREEFVLLAKSAGAEIISHQVVQRQRPNPKYFVGTGKADELAELVQRDEIALAIFDHTLSPAQERNLEKILKCRVIDRNGLILDIFAQRARTHEGKLQVELAQLKHLSTRLIRGFGDLEQQKGGIGLRGPGESQLETDRRLIRVRIGQLKEKLDKVRQTRTQGRASRKKATIPTLALVGYTNAGKSTLFNTLSNSEVYAADQLFATLDPTLRRVEWAGVGDIILADTVGFIKHLDHELVDAFRATLEETIEATLLLHVIDASNPDMLEQIEAVEKVLHDIGADVPMLRVFNKIDQSGDEAKIIYHAPNHPDRVYISAHSQIGLDLLFSAVRETLQGQQQQFEVCLHAEHGKLYGQLHHLQVIRSENYNDFGQRVLIVEMTGTQLIQLIRQNRFDEDAILSTQAEQFKPQLEAFEQK